VLHTDEMLTVEGIADRLKRNLTRHTNCTNKIILSNARTRTTVE